MLAQILGQTARDVGIGAGGATLAGVIALLIKRGISGNFRIGGGESKSDAEASARTTRTLSDARRDQLVKQLVEIQERDRHNREICNLRHGQIDKHIEAINSQMGKLETKLDSAMAQVHAKLDNIIIHLIGDAGDKNG